MEGTVPPSQRPTSADHIALKVIRIVPNLYSEIFGGRDFYIALFDLSVSIELDDWYLQLTPESNTTLNIVVVKPNHELFAGRISLARLYGSCERCTSTTSSAHVGATPETRVDSLDGTHRFDRHPASPRAAAAPPGAVNRVAVPARNGQSRYLRRPGRSRTMIERRPVVISPRRRNVVKALATDSATPRCSRPALPGRGRHRCRCRRRSGGHAHRPSRRDRRRQPIVCCDPNSTRRLSESRSRSTSLRSTAVDTRGRCSRYAEKSRPAMTWATTRSKATKLAEHAARLRL